MPVDKSNDSKKVCWGPKTGGRKQGKDLKDTPERSSRREPYSEANYFPPNKPFGFLELSPLIYNKK